MTALAIDSKLNVTQPLVQPAKIPVVGNNNDKIVSDQQSKVPSRSARGIESPQIHTGLGQLQPSKAQLHMDMASKIGRGVTELSKTNPEISQCGEFVQNIEEKVFEIRSNGGNKNYDTELPTVQVFRQVSFIAQTATEKARAQLQQALENIPWNEQESRELSEIQQKTYSNYVTAKLGEMLSTS